MTVLNALFSKVLDEGGFWQKNDPSRVSNLRFSGLPFCPVKAFLSYPSTLSPSAWKDFKFQFYTSVGTSVHIAIQTALANLESLPNGAVLYGDWKCSKCGTLHKFQPAPSSCTACGNEALSFEEVEVELDLSSESKPASTCEGHLDTVLKFPDGSFTIVDWKTTSTSGVSSAVRNPDSSYLAQLRSYASALSLQYSANVTRIALGFVPRDNPNGTDFYEENVTPESLGTYSKLLRKWSRQHYTLVRSSTLEDLQPLIDSRPCRERMAVGHEKCKFAIMCAGNDEGCTSLVNTVFSSRTASRLPVVKPT